MSRHEGVSCDSCLKGNFRGKRYKCLVCYDYDLCANCYEAGATTTRHSNDHPVQCILTKADFELYYGGEALPAEQAQSFTCPYCGKMGFTEVTLQEHVTSEHADASTEVVCPICAALPGGDPNHVTDDFSAHLTLEHRTSREFEEPSGIRHVRRIPHPARGVGSTRSRRANMHIPPGGSTLSGLSPNGRESMDPIAELLSQLSSVRSRAAAAQSVSSQLQQLEMQLQSTNRIDGAMATTQSVNASSTGGVQSWSRFQSWLAPDHGQQLERLPRRQAEIPKPPAVTTTTTTTPNSSTEPPSAASSSNSHSNLQFLLPRCMEFALSEGDQSNLEMDHSLFVQEVLLSTLADELQPQFLEKMLQLEIGSSSGTSPAEEKLAGGGGGSGSSTSGNGGNSSTVPTGSGPGAIGGGGGTSSSSSSSPQQKSTVKSKALRQRPALESSLHSQPTKGVGGGGLSSGGLSSGGNGSSNSSSNNINNNAPSTTTNTTTTTTTTPTGSGASGGPSSGTQNISAALKHQMSSQSSSSSHLASRSASSGTSPISGPTPSSQSSSLTQANIVLLSGQAGNLGRGLNAGGMVGGGGAAPQAQSRSAGLRDALVNTSSAKRNMLKHLEATKASDREPPPH